VTKLVGHRATQHHGKDISGIVSAVPVRDALVIDGGQNWNRSKTELRVLVHTGDMPGQQPESGSLRCPASLADFLRFVGEDLFQTVQPDYPHTSRAKNPKRFAFGRRQDRVRDFSIVVYQDGIVFACLGPASAGLAKPKTKPSAARTRLGRARTRLCWFALNAECRSVAAAFTCRLPRRLCGEGDDRFAGKLPQCTGGRKKLRR
jgi:hypothetical protein